MFKASNSSIEQNYNERSELITNEQEVAAQPIIITQATAFRQATRQKDNGCKLAQRQQNLIANNLAFSRPIIETKDWLNLRRKSSEPQLSSTNHQTHYKESRLQPLPAQDSPKSCTNHLIHSKDSRLPHLPSPISEPMSKAVPKSSSLEFGQPPNALAPPKPRRKSSTSNENYSIASSISYVNERNFKRSSKSTEKQVFLIRIFK